MSLQNISFDEPKNQRRRRRSTKRIIQTIKPSCAPDFTKRPAAYPASSGFLNGPSCKYMKKPIAAPHSPPTLQKSRSSLPNFQAGAITFLTCIATASVLEMLVRGGREPPQNIRGGVLGRLDRELAPIQYKTLIEMQNPLHGASRRRSP